MVDSVATAAINAAQTGQVFLTLLSITHSGLATPLNFVNDFTNCVSNGVTYIAWPFSLPFPETGSDVLPTLTLSIDNVSDTIWASLIEFQDPLTVTLSWVLASQPNVVEGGPISFRMRQAVATMTTIQGTLVFEDLLNEPYPYESFTPSTAPGLF